MMTVRVEGGQGSRHGVAQLKEDDATHPEVNENQRRVLNRHANDAASHIEIDAQRLDLARITNPQEVLMKYSEDNKREDDQEEEDQKQEEPMEGNKKVSCKEGLKRSESENHRGQEQQMQKIPSNGGMLRKGTEQQKDLKLLNNKEFSNTPQQN